MLRATTGSHWKMRFEATRNWDVGYLFHATALTANIGGHEITDMPMRRVGIVRELLRGAPSQRPTPPEQPGAVLRFVIAGSVYEVRVWAEHFAYAGRTYEHKRVLEGLRQIEATP